MLRGPVIPSREINNAKQLGFQSTNSVDNLMDIAAWEPPLILVNRNLHLFDCSRLPMHLGSENI